MINKTLKFYNKFNVIFVCNSTRLPIHSLNILFRPKYKQFCIFCGPSQFLSFEHTASIAEKHASLNIEECKKIFHYVTTTTACIFKLPTLCLSFVWKVACRSISTICRQSTLVNTASVLIAHVLHVVVHALF